MQTKIIVAILATIIGISAPTAYVVSQPSATPDVPQLPVQGDIVVVPDIVSVQFVELKTPESADNPCPPGTIKYIFSHNGTYGIRIAEQLKPLMLQFPLAPVDYDPQVPIFGITPDRIEICALEPLNSTALAQSIRSLLEAP